MEDIQKVESTVSSAVESTVSSAVENTDAGMELVDEHGFGCIDDHGDHPDHKVEELPVKIYSIGDIHSEFYESMAELEPSLPMVSAKFCILAGDIGCVMSKPDMLRGTLQFFKKRHKHVLMVPGNHEYYKSGFQFEAVNKRLAIMCEEEGVILLNRRTVSIDGVTFIGATLWSAIDDSGAQGLNDFSYVFASKLDYLEQFVDDYRFIKSELLKTLDSPNKVVVVTHHLPTRRLIHPRFQGHPMNSAFYTNLVDIEMMHKIKYWFCGHTHEHGKIKHGDTILTCNPMGYPGEMRFTKLSRETFDV
jgi:Icc-related predicted phosphoesterase